LLLVAYREGKNIPIGRCGKTSNLGSIAFPCKKALVHETEINGLVVLGRGYVANNKIKIIPNVHHILKEQVGTHQNFTIPQSGRNAPAHLDHSIAVKTDQALGLIKITIVDQIGMQAKVAIHLQVATVVQPSLGCGKTGEEEDGYVQ